jgi:hypothetical protein
VKPPAEKMPAALIEQVCRKLHYIPSGNVTGLHNGSACILYDQWTPNSVCVHSYIPDPRFLTKGFLVEMFRYPFTNVDWVIGVTPGDNAKALAFNQRIGFTERDRLPQGFAKGVDTVVQVMHYSECRWWRRKEREPKREQLLDTPRDEPSRRVEQMLDALSRTERS